MVNTWTSLEECSTNLAKNRNIYTQTISHTTILGATSDTFENHFDVVCVIYKCMYYMVVSWTKLQIGGLSCKMLALLSACFAKRVRFSFL